MFLYFLTVRQGSRSQSENDIDGSTAMLGIITTSVGGLKADNFYFILTENNQSPIITFVVFLLSNYSGATMKRNKAHFMLKLTVFELET